MQRHWVPCRQGVLSSSWRKLLLSSCTRHHQCPENDAAPAVASGMCEDLSSPWWAQGSVSSGPKTRSISRQVPC